MSRRLVLNAGAGLMQALPAGFQDGTWQEVNLDLDPRTKPNILASVTDIPRENSCFDAVYCSHTLEHLYAHEVPKALAEFRRVLTAEGFCVIVCPDLLAICRAILALGADRPLLDTDAGPVSALDMLFGHRASVANGQELMAHRSAFTEETLKAALEAAGFVRVGCGTGTMYDLYGVGYASEIGRGVEATSGTVGLQAQD